jgi:Zn-dependent peptidase ImmA (M78 family)/transcriptional regulator with XRE-family HTH domain
MSNLGEVLETARRARGLTRDQLSELTGVSVEELYKYERDLRVPDRAALAVLAPALGVTENFLNHAGRVYGGMAVEAHMRRYKTAPASLWRRLESRLNMNRMHASLLFEEVTVQAEQRVPRFDPLEVSPEDAARMVRMQWRIPLGPVRSLVRWLESAGCLIIEEDFGNSRVDGLSQWIDDHPVIMLNKSAPTDRKRLTLAHELGHLCLHSDEASEDMEAEATAFAAQFLTPAEMIAPQLRNLKLGKLHDLKREWGVSMQSLVERAAEQKMITPSQRSSFYKTFSARGWRVQEPLSDELPLEEPSLPGNIARALYAKGLSETDIAVIAGFSSAEDNDVFVIPRRQLRAV